MTAINQDTTTQVIDATPAAVAELDNPQAQPPVVSATPADLDAQAADAVVGDIALEDPLTTAVQPMYDAVRDQERMNVEIQNASGVADALQGMQAAMGGAFNREGVSRAETEALQVAIEALVFVTGIPTTTNLAFESHDRRRHDNAQLVMENLGDLVVQVIDAIARVIAGVMEWLKDFYMKLTSNAKQLRNKALAVRERLVRKSKYKFERPEDEHDAIKTGNADRLNDRDVNEDGQRSADDNDSSAKTTQPGRLAVLIGRNDKDLKLGPQFVGEFETYVNQVVAKKNVVWSLYNNIERQFDDLIKSAGDDEESFKAAANSFAKGLTFADHGLEKTKAVEVPEGMVALLDELPFGHMSVVHVKVQDLDRGWQLVGKTNMSVRRTPGQSDIGDEAQITPLKFAAATRVVDSVVKLAEAYIDEGIVKKQVDGLTKLMKDLRAESKKISKGEQARVLRHAAEAFTRMLTQGVAAKRSYDIKIGLGALAYVAQYGQNALGHKIERMAEEAAGAA